MWPSVKYTTTMSTPRLPVARPWTPPDLEAEDLESSSQYGQIDYNTSSATQFDSGYFGEALPDPPNEDIDLNALWPLSAKPSPNPSSISTKESCHRDGNTNRRDSKLEVAKDPSRPHTPIKSPAHNETRSHPPQYPFTPDSDRKPTLDRLHTFPSMPALAPMPWSPSNLHAHPSPVQGALFSCMSNLEHLISTSQPNDQQMEYIIAQFEAISSFLSAPEAQSKESDDFLFADVDNALAGTAPRESGIGEAYVKQVGIYIDGVKENVKGLKARLGETKQLNDIQADVIADLKRELRSRERESSIVEEILRELASKDQGSSGPEGGRKEVGEDSGVPEGISKKKKGFWACVGEALDEVGELLLEW